MTTILKRLELGRVGNVPGKVLMSSTNTKSEITAAGFMNAVQAGSGVTIQPTDFIEAVIADNEFVVFAPSFGSDGIITLIDMADSGLPVVPDHDYVKTIWVAQNGLDTNSGENSNVPKLTPQAALDALPAGGVIQIPDNGTYTGNLVFPTGQNYSIIAPSATLAAGAGPHFTANGSVIYVNVATISSNGKEVISFTNNATLFLNALACFGNFTRTTGVVVVNGSEMGGNHTTSALGDTILRFRTLTGNVTDTSGVGSNRVGLYGETLTGNVASTNTKVYGDVLNVTGTLSGVLFGNFGPSTAGDGTQSGTFIGGGLSINDSKVLNEIYTVETVTAPKAVRLVDGNKLFLYNSGSDQNFTLPQYSTDSTIPLGFRFWVVQAAAGFAGFLTEGSDVLLYTGTLATTAGEGTKVEVELVIKAASGNSFVNTWALNGNVYGGGP